MTRRILLIACLILAFCAHPALAGEYSDGSPAGGTGNATYIQSVPVDAPVAGDDGNYIVYDHGNLKFDYGTPAGGGDMTAAVWDGDSDGFIDADAGGTDIDTSASTGVPSIAAGTWSVAATLTHELGGLEADVSAYAGLVHITGGVTSAKSVSANGLSLIAGANYAAMRTLLDLEAGTDFYDIAAADAAFEGELTNSAGLLAALDDETGTGVAVFNINPSLTGVTIAGDITSTATAIDWDLIDDNVSALSFDAAGKTGIINILTSNAAEGVTMSGYLTVSGVLTSSGVLDATTAGANITLADGQLIDLSGVIPTAATDEGLIVPSWVDVVPTTDAPFITYDAAANAIKVYDGGWIEIGAAGGGAPVGAKYIVQQADGTLSAEQSLGALGSGILYSTTTTGVVSIATESQLETTLGIGFGASKAATAGYVLVMDGTDLESVVMSGDVTIAAGGATTIGADTVALTTDTTGNYVLSIADAGNSNITVVNGVAEGGAVTLDVVDLTCTDCINATEIEDIYLLIAGDSMAGTLTMPDAIGLDFGTGADFTMLYDEAADDRLEIEATNAAADTETYFYNSDGTYKQNVRVEGDVIADSFQASGAGESYLELGNNGSSPTLSLANGIYVVNNAIKFYENSIEIDPITSADSPTWTGQHDFSTAAASLTLPSTAADASGEISMSAGNELTWHDGTKVVVIDTTVTTDNYVLKYDNASATFNLEADETGGTPAWEAVTDPTGDQTLTHDAAEQTIFEFTGAFGAGTQFQVAQNTGNPTAGTLFEVEGDDDNIVLAQFGDTGGTNYWRIAEVSANNYQLLNAGAATFNLAAATDLLIAGGQIDIDDLASITATASEINTPLDGATVTLTEFQELEAIGATTISANQWAMLGGVAETLAAAELDILDGVSGVTAAELSYIGDVTGLIQAQIDGKADEGISTVTDANGLTLSAAQCQAGVIVYATGAGSVVTCPPVAGASFTVIDYGGAAVVIDPNADDYLILDGVLLAQNANATSTSTTGDMIVCTYQAADIFYCASGSPDGDHWTGP